MNGESASGELRRMSSVPTMGWPADVDLDVWYKAESKDVDDLIKSAMDLSVWSLETKRENVSVFLHCKNNEKQSYSVRAVAKVTGTVANVTECLRSTDSSTFRGFQKLLHSKSFADGEVLHAHHRNNQEMESLSLKWMTFWAQKTLGKGKEFCMREYCTMIPNHPKYGTVGVCSFESYDGMGARYGIRSKPDAYSLTLFEPSAYIVQQTPEEGIVSVTLTMSMRKARGESVSSGVKLLAMRLALDMGYLQRAMQHTLFQPGALADKKEWVNDGDRTNCSLCVQTFGMLKRRHHCRVCGEVVCSACTVFKQVNGDQDLAKVRVCKACLAKSASTDSAAATGASVTATTNTSICSTSSGMSSSDGSRSSNDDAAPIAPLSHMPQYQHQPSYTASPYSSYQYQSAYSKTSSSSFNDFDMNPVPSNISSNGDSPPPYLAEKTQLLHPSLQKSLSTTSSSAASTTSSSRGHAPPGSSSRSLNPSSHHHQRRINYFNEDFEEICMLAMETLQCPMAGIRTDDFELVRYYEGKPPPGLPRSLPTFRRIAARGKPCIVLDVSSDKRISGEKRFTAKLQFFVGIPLMIDGEVIGDLCVADRFARDMVDFKQVEVLNVLGTTVTQYMQSHDYMEDLVMFKTMRSHQSSNVPRDGGAGAHTPLSSNSNGGVQVKEVAF